MIMRTGARPITNLGMISRKQFRRINKSDTEHFSISRNIYEAK